MIDSLEQLIDGLNALGFSGGYVAKSNPLEIILWENDEPQPTLKQIESAYIKSKSIQERAELERKEAIQSALEKLAKLGLTEEEAKAIAGV
jgi:ABC-type hemin transport system substrate-binding protein